MYVDSYVHNECGFVKGKRKQQLNAAKMSKKVLNFLSFLLAMNLETDSLHFLETSKI